MTVRLLMICGQKQPNSQNNNKRKGKKELDGLQ